MQDNKFYRARLLKGNIHRRRRNSGRRGAVADGDDAALLALALADGHRAALRVEVPQLQVYRRTIRTEGIRAPHIFDADPPTLRRGKGSDSG